MPHPPVPGRRRSTAGLLAVAVGLLSSVAVAQSLPPADAEATVEIARAAGAGLAADAIPTSLDARTWRTDMAARNGTAPSRAQAARLLAEARRQGLLPVVIQMDMDFRPEGEMTDDGEVAAQRAVIADLRMGMFARLGMAQATDASWGGSGIEAVKTFDTVPMVAMQVSAGKLLMLLRDPAVAMIHRDLPVPTATFGSIPQINADDLHVAGVRGNGWAVAVLDTGVDRSHPFLANRIVAEACFSTAARFVSTSLCPGGVPAAEAVGAGVDCPVAVAGCGHGTHVAGIAAGGPVSLNTRDFGRITLTGVANGASLIAIQVFSRFDSPTDCNGRAPCALSYSSDQMRALERVFALRSRFRIAAVNMSLGGGRFALDCATNPLRPIVDNLRSVGIATVIAAGNAGFADAVASPACLPSAVAVGATGPDDKVADFSNHSNQVELLAPGVDIASSRAGTYHFLSGTSQAAPHVAGAFAQLRQLAPAASVTELLRALQAGGVPVRDPANGIERPRLDVRAAAGRLSPVFAPTATGTAPVRR